MPRTSPLLVPLLVVAALAAGCGDDGDAADQPDGTTTTTEPEVTTTAVDPFSVPEDPADITEEYVEAVLTELEKINGDALRLALSDGFSTRVTDLLETAMDGQPLADRANSLATLNPEEFGDQAGDISVTVESVVRATETCLAADINEDYSRVAAGGISGVAVRVTLTASNSNSTGWVVTGRDVLGRGETVEPCVDS